jgi:hypothetical protein
MSSYESKEQLLPSCDPNKFVSMSYSRKVDFEKASVGNLVYLPHHHIFNTEESEKFGLNPKKRKFIGKGRLGSVLQIIDDPKFLVEHPLVVCAYKEGSTIWPAVLDGHHRKKATEMKQLKNPLPCRVLSIEEALDFINQHMNNTLAADQFTEQLAISITRAQISPGTPSARPIRGVSSLQEFYLQFRKEE